MCRSRVLPDKGPAGGGEPDSEHQSPDAPELCAVRIGAAESAPPEGLPVVGALSGHVVSGPTKTGKGTRMRLLHRLDELDRRSGIRRARVLSAHEQLRAMRKMWYLPVVLVVLGPIALALAVGVPNLLAFAPIVPGVLFIGWAEWRI